MDAYATTLLNKHNDLLEKIAKLCTSPDTSADSKHLATALMSVVTTHTIVQVRRGKSGLKKRCTECGFAYPCSTIEFIERELQ
jgi:hypothetical protein